MHAKITLLTSILLLSIALQAQQPAMTSEDYLYRDTTSSTSRTAIGGYGNAFFQRDVNAKTSKVNLERFVLFLGHKFNKKISVFAELELEDAKIEGGKFGGEFALEQCYLKFNIKPNHSIVAGLFLPRIGILNENHLPNAFNGNERTMVETFIIPSTWRELGVGYYGNSLKLPLAYSVAIVNGLSAGGFEHGSFIREGRFEGSNATFNNLAITAALQLNKNNFKAQVSAYYGGSVGLAPSNADSLKLTSGLLGTPVIFGEANVQYANKGISAKLLGTIANISDASAINRAYANNTAMTAYGVYVEIGYNIFEQIKKLHAQQLIIFARYEKLDMNAAIPDNGIKDGTLDQQHVVLGIGYLPIKNVVIKADARLQFTGDQNSALIINPSPTTQPYRTANTFVNIGIGFSF